MTTIPSVLVLGVGNIMMQDDGVGVRALRTLADAYELPAYVRLLDGGVAGLRLLPELEGVEHLLVIDAVVGGGPPGTIYRLAPEELPPDRGAILSAHAVGIRQLFSVVDLMGLLGKRPQSRILGVQPLKVAVGPELTPPLRDALPRVVAAAVEELQALGMEVKVKGHRLDRGQFAGMDSAALTVPCLPAGRSPDSFICGGPCGSAFGAPSDAPTPHGLSAPAASEPLRQGPPRRPAHRPRSSRHRERKPTGKRVNSHA